MFLVSKIPLITVLGTEGILDKYSIIIIIIIIIIITS